MFRRHGTNLFGVARLAIISVAVVSAFTSANTFDAHAGNQLGDGTPNVSGAQITSTHDTLRSDGVTVDTVTLVALGDLTQGVSTEHGFVGFTVPGIPGPDRRLRDRRLRRHNHDNVHVRCHQPGPRRCHRSGNRRRCLELVGMTHDTESRKRCTDRHRALRRSSTAT